jgi:hypothetical protein
VLSAHFIPFRSPSVASLHEPAKSREFAHSLWSQILGAWIPRILITIDRTTYSAITDILDAQPGSRVIDRETFPTGWGSYEADVKRFEGLQGRGTVTLVRLPHLSRFTLFGSPARQPALDSLLDYVTAPSSGAFGS